MKSLITGGAGCIGSDLAEALVRRGDEVLVVDNLSSGKREHVEALLAKPNFEFREGDILNAHFVGEAMQGVDMVWHLAANPDVKFSPGDPTNRDLEQNTIATYAVLEAMRRTGIKKIAFSSTSAVYGPSSRQPIPEDAPARPISLYGASKLGSEGLITAFHGMFGMQAWIFRFANIVGSKVRKKGGTVIGDFIKRLSDDPHQLLILGDGKQAKSYLLSEECVEAMLLVTQHATAPVNIFNLGCNDSLSVTAIADLVVEAMGLSGVQYTFTGGEGGWPGDVPRFTLDVSLVNKLGWKARRTSREAVAEAIRSVIAARTTH